MRKSVFTLLAVVMTLFVVAPSEPATLKKYFGKSYALVIGINQYESKDWDSLSYAVQDAKAMADFLTKQNFDVTPLYEKDATRGAILGYFDQVRSKLRADDRMLVFYAGHGGTRLSAGKEYGYIVPTDGGRGKASNIQMDELRSSALEMDGAKHLLFILDACYGGLLGATRGSKVAKEHPTYINEITRRKARQVLTAGGADQQVADGGPGGHSFFTYNLLQALDDAEGDLNGDGYITFSELAAYIVPAAYNYGQTPTYSTLAGHKLGEFVFLSSKPPSQTPRRPSVVLPSIRRGADPTESEDILGVVSDFIKANNDEDVDAILRTLSTKPSYYSWGPTSPHKIREDKQYFFGRWPDVEYTLVGEPEVISKESDRFQVKSKFDFFVRSMERCEGRHGESSFTLGIENIRNRWKITSIKEDVLYRDKPFQPCTDQQPSVTSSRPRAAEPMEFEEILSFVSDFFKANNDEDVDAFLRMFSTKPSYYSWGPTSLSKVKKDKQSFFRKWPEVEYAPIGEPEVIKKGSNRFQVNINFDYYVRSMRRCKGQRGESSFKLGIENIRNRWKITSINENVYYRDKSFQPC